MSRISSHDQIDKGDKATIAEAVGHIPSGLFIVCARDKKSAVIDGYLASWIQQISFKPLLILIAVKPGRPAYDLIMKGDVFSVNIIGDHDSSFLKLFWSGYDPKSNPFDKLEKKISDSGGVILSAARSTIECRMHSNIKPGDHELVIAEVINSYIQNNNTESLVHFRKTGLDY